MVKEQYFISLYYVSDDQPSAAMHSIPTIWSYKVTGMDAKPTGIVVIHKSTYW
jgi:hypothetical protein